MKRVVIIAGLAIGLPRAALAQIPVAQPAESAPPAQAIEPAPPQAEPPAAEQTPPGDQYFVEPAPPAAEPPAPVPFEPPPPGAASAGEPVPPPKEHHVASSTALVLGARLGWFIPFGNVWARAKPVPTSAGGGYVLEGVPWRDYASSGPMFELNAGLRLARAYTIFGLWERAQLGSGDDASDGKPDGAETDFFAVGLRASSNPDRLGFITEVAIGYRRARSFYENGLEVQFTNAPFEARLGLGGELRLDRMIALSALVTVGVGGFGDVQKVAANGNAVPKTFANDEADGHAWATLTFGGHFDLVRSKD